MVPSVKDLKTVSNTAQLPTKSDEVWNCAVSDGSFILKEFNKT